MVAAGRAFPDALAASYVAGRRQAPILLTERAGVPAATVDALRSLGVRAVTVVGGVGAIEPSVVSELQRAGYSVTRIAGETRYETASALARTPGPSEMNPVDGRRTALLASGEGFADALAGGPLAYGSGLPVLLTERLRLTAHASEALQELGIEHVVVLGGAAAISDVTVASVRALGITTERLAGTDRVGTAAEIASFAIDRLNWQPNGVTVANGATFPDALAGASMAGLARNPLLLTPSASQLGERNSAWISSRPEVQAAVALGGPGVISDAVLQAASEAMHDTSSPSTTSTSTPAALTDPCRPGAPTVKVAGATTHVIVPGSGLYLLPADGSAPRQLMPGDSFGPTLPPAWAPDGERIVITMAFSLRVVDTSGIERWRLESGAATGFYSYAWADWSPDGTTIAFAAHTRPIDDPDRQTQLFVVDADGSNVRRVGTVPGPVSHVRWSPDSSRIAYHNETRLISVRPDGTGLRTIESTGPGGSHDWAPTSDAHVIQNRRVDGSDLAVASASGLERRIVEPGVQSEMDWSPNSGCIAFRRTHLELASATAPSGTRVLAGSEERAINPSWAPDGRSLLYGCYLHNPNDAFDLSLCTINADGSGFRHLVDVQGTIDATNGRWAPTGDAIAFLVGF